MPIVTVKLYEGRTMEQKKAVSVKICNAIAEEMNVSIDHVTVIFEDMKKENYSKGGVFASEKK